jgi:hypothetical protein
MGKLDDFMSKQPNFHKDKDGNWGTDEHDGKIIGDVIKAIFSGIAEIIKAKK